METNLTYIYCTIAIGEKYLNSALKFVKDLNSISKTHKVLIVTDIDLDPIDNCVFHKISNDEVLFISNYFNYNLKHIPIKICSELDYQFVFYFDSDWEIDDLYEESKVLNFLKIFDGSDIDFFFERPHYIGAKHDLSTCFWRHKIEPYKLMETIKYDNGHVCNEQFLAFKNNDKLKIFCEKWKERNDFGVEKNIWAFAEGLEIGMSSIDAEMNFSWLGLQNLNSCFKFTSNSGIEYKRF